MWATLKTFSLDDDNFPTMIENVALLLRTMIVNIYKNDSKSKSRIFFYNFHYNRSSIRETVQKFLTFDAEFEPGTRFSNNLRKYLRVVKKRAISIWIFLVINGIVYVLIPFIRPGRHVTEELYILYGLEPMLESPNYEIVHIVTTISVGFCVYLMVNVAIYVIVIVGYNEAQMFTICIEVRNLWDDKKIVNEYIRIRLKAIIHYHVTNIHLFRELNNEFSDTLAIEYSIMSIAIIAELLGGLENTYLQVPYTVVQIFMDCLSGQRLIDACREFENALYSCEWENFNADNQKTISLMLLISQNTLMLSAGGMANLNFECLMMILKSAYSAYTALKSSINK
ncbi:uncharacterized protein LOC120631219 [Pararge aegeria]|uniref:uncharacterized protein LOC120631219 n=1 Tax=Pararge aegeria TaxID=116150 RepID=UPI0019CFA9D8|nr:uncharacterized protein LOC120631219 [Pararge aegeria]